MSKSSDYTHFITSKDNDFFKKVKSYVLAKNRIRDKVVLVEGKKSFEEALSALRLRHALLDEDFCLNSLTDLPSEKRTRLSNHLFGVLSETKSPQGIIGIFDMPDQELDMSLQNKVVVLEGVQDPGNVGTIIRTAFFLGYQAVLLDEACAAPFSPKAIRSSMGALFHIPCVTAPIEQHLSNLKKAEFAIVGSDLCGDDLQSRADSLSGQKFALLVGSEGQGLSKNALSYCDYRYRISAENDEAESLNAAVASGIMMYQLNI